MKILLVAVGSGVRGVFDFERSLSMKNLMVVVLFVLAASAGAVSYTHLTLPTICSV